MPNYLCFSFEGFELTTRVNPGRSLSDRQRPPRPKLLPGREHREQLWDTLVTAGRRLPTVAGVCQVGRQLELLDLGRPDPERQRPEERNSELGLVTRLPGHGNGAQRQVPPLGRRRRLVKLVRTGLLVEKNSLSSFSEREGKKLHSLDRHQKQNERRIFEEDLLPGSHRAWQRPS